MAVLPEQRRNGDSLAGFSTLKCSYCDEMFASTCAERPAPWKWPRGEWKALSWCMRGARRARAGPAAGTPGDSACLVRTGRGHHSEGPPDRGPGAPLWVSGVLSRAPRLPAPKPEERLGPTGTAGHGSTMMVSCHQ